jgi:hypothetical protein
MILSKTAFGFLSLVISTFGYGLYIRSVAKNLTRPHFFSWLIWSLISGIICFAQLSDGAGPGAWALGYSMICCSLVTIMALKFGEKNITRSDWVCLIVALSIIPVWQLTHNALWAVLLGCAIDGAAYIPTYRKSFIRPNEEHLSTWYATILRSIVSLFALENYTFITMLPPIFIIAVEGSFIAMVLLRRVRLAKNLAS